MLTRSGVVNLGSTVPAFRYVVMVLRDSPVRHPISRIESFSRNDMRLMMFKIPCGSLRCPPLRKALEEAFTWLNSQRKLSAKPAHFWVEINRYATQSPVTSFQL